MTEPDGKFEEEIRCALRTAGDLVVPAGDGLIKIRERTVYRPRPMAWIFAYTHHLLTLPLLWLRLPASELAATARGHSSLKPRLRSARHWPRLILGALRTPSLWIRPVLAASAALALVIGIALAIPGLRGSLRAELAGGSTGSGTNHTAGGTLGQAGNPQSSGLASGIGPGGVTGPIPGLPWDATVAPSPGPSATCQGSGQRASVPVPYAPIPPAPQPGIGQTAGAGAMTGGAPGSPALPNQGSGGAMDKTGPGTGAQTTACSRASRPSASTSPTSQPPTTVPPTTPVTTPPTTPVTTPPTTPVTTPPTSPTGTPTTTPTGTPSQTASPAGSGTPTGTASPG